jgi:ubiquinone/menaquinone biosynthesis C-methylase UbiE
LTKSAFAQFSIRINLGISGAEMRVGWSPDTDTMTTKTSGLTPDEQTDNSKLTSSAPFDSPTLRRQGIALLRALGLLPAADEFRFLLNVRQNRKKNREFAASRPSETFPPARLAYDAYSFVDYENYYNGGRHSAEAVLDLMSPHIQLRGARVLEWGCGPGRIVRQLAQLGRELGVEVFATDYNRASIEWCKSAISGVTFATNGLQPPLPFPDGFFDVIYSSSVFTHLSEAMHYTWLQENFRVVKCYGLVIFTTQGDRMKDKLLPSEARQYSAGQLVVRTARSEGARAYGAFQSPAFVMNSLLPSIPGAELLRHDTKSPLAGIQDVWVIRKN